MDFAPRTSSLPCAWESPNRRSWRCTSTWPTIHLFRESDGDGARLRRSSVPRQRLISNNDSRKRASGLRLALRLLFEPQGRPVYPPVGCRCLGGAACQRELEADRGCLRTDRAVSAPRKGVFRQRSSTRTHAIGKST